MGMPMTALQHIEAAIGAPGLYACLGRPTLQLQPIATAAARAHEEAYKRGHERRQKGTAAAVATHQQQQQQKEAAEAAAAGGSKAEIVARAHFAPLMPVDAVAPDGAGGKFKLTGEEHGVPKREQVLFKALLASAGSNASALDGVPAHKRSLVLHQAALEARRSPSSWPLALQAANARAVVGLEAGGAGMHRGVLAALRAMGLDHVLGAYAAASPSEDEHVQAAVWESAWRSCVWDVVEAAPGAAAEGSSGLGGFHRRRHGALSVYAASRTGECQAAGSGGIVAAMTGALAMRLHVAAEVSGELKRA